MLSVFWFNIISKAVPLRVKFWPHLKNLCEGLRKTSTLWLSNTRRWLRLGPLVSFPPSSAPRKRLRLLPYHRLLFPVARVDMRYLQRSRRRRGGQVFHLTAKTAVIRPYQREHGSSLFPLILVSFTSIVLSTPSHSFSPSLFSLSLLFLLTLPVPFLPPAVSSCSTSCR